MIDTQDGEDAKPSDRDHDSLDWNFMPDQTISALDSVLAVAALVKAGKLRHAKRAAAAMLDRADDRSRAVLADCAAILAQETAIARPQLVALWKAADREGRAIIEACAPDNWSDRAVTADEPTAPVTRRPSRPVQRTVRKEARRRPASPEQAQRNKLAAALMTAYDADRSLDNEREPFQTIDGYALDYDHAALHPLRGTACVVCSIERSTAEQHPTGHTDDGLCGNCRESGFPGIEPQPTGHSPANVTAARCAYLARLYPADLALALLRRDWCAASPHIRVVIADWVTTHTTPRAADADHRTPVAA